MSVTGQLGLQARKAHSLAAAIFAPQLVEEHVPNRERHGPLDLDPGNGATRLATKLVLHGLQEI